MAKTIITGQFAATQLDRLAGLYVTGNSGLLTAVAGRDINLTAAEVNNTHGNSELTAGRNLNLDTLTLSQQSDLRYSPGNTAKFGYQKEIGSTLKSGGKLALAAGNDINARAARIDAEGDLSLKAGNDITLSAGRNEQFIESSGHSQTKSKKLFGGTKESKDFSLNVDTTTAQISTLSGKNISLETGNTGTLATQGSRITATDDLRVKAGTILLDAAYDGERSNSSSSLIGKTTQQKSEQKESLTATGSILSAGRNLSLTSSGDTTVIGSALAAGEKVTIKTGGNLALLAAESSSERQIDDYTQTKKRATTLAFEQKEVRQLLSTITVGSGLNIQVGGNFTADIGEKNPDGSLIADRMTVDGVVRGAARQQVDIKTTGVGANSNATSSQVLGALNGVGIRNGANDSFTPKAAIAGGDALQQYLNSGLVQIQNNPQLADQLKNVLSNPGGASLTYKDDSGNISLTVAGQAKVQEVFNTLKISESFDTKKLTDQGTAQIVTLVAAVVLTVCTAGAGALSLGALAAGANTLGAAMINAAIIGMSSTMIGQLAGGASFDQAFQAGVKAGATSALMAGVSAGIGDLVGSPPTTQVSGSTVQAGTNAASSTTSSLQAMGTSQYWAQTGLNALAKGTLASAQGGKFEDGVIGSVLGSLSASGAGIIGDSTSGNPLGNILSHAVLGCAVAAAGKQDCASGALGGAASATLARVIDAGIGDGLDGKAREAVIAGGAVAGSAALVGALGGNVMTAGNAASNEVLNNYLSQKSTKPPERSEQERYNEAAARGDTATTTALGKTSAENDRMLAMACADPNSGPCKIEIQAAINAGNKVVVRTDGTYVAYPADTPELKTQTRPASEFQDQTAKGLVNSLPVVATTLTPGLLPIRLSTLGWGAAGGAISGTSDALGQYSQNGEIRWGQSAVSAFTNALTTPLAMRYGYVGQVVLGGISGAANTEFKNAYYGDTNSVIWGATVGAGANVVGYKSGQVFSGRFQAFQPGTAALLQKPNLTGFYLGNTLGNFIQSTPSYFNTDVSNKVLP